MPHVHVHAPHELSERGSEAGGSPSRRERVLELGAVLLLSIATVATAWSGYQAARWSGEQSEHISPRRRPTASGRKREATNAGQLRIDDLVLFNNWLNAHDAGNNRLAAEYRRRFPARIRAGLPRLAGPAPVHQSTRDRRAAVHASVPARGADRAKAFDAKADNLYREGTAAKTNDDKYILSTVFFAAVLFLAGISLRMDWRPLRMTVLGLAGAMLLGGAVFVLTLPIARRSQMVELPHIQCVRARSADTRR